MVHALTTAAQPPSEDHPDLGHGITLLLHRPDTFLTGAPPLEPPLDPTDLAAGDAPSLVSSQNIELNTAKKTGESKNSPQELSPKPTHTLRVFTELSLISARQSSHPPMAPGIGGFNIEPPPVQSGSRGGELAENVRSFHSLEFPGRLPIEGTQVKRGALPVRLVRSSLLAILLGIAGLAYATVGSNLPSLLRAFIEEQVASFTALHGTISESRARLIVEPQRGLANEPLPVGISLEDSSGDESVILGGLTAGTELSLGMPQGRDGWIISVRDLDKAYFGAPRDFLGVMDATVDLRSASGRLLDRKALRLEWTDHPTVASAHEMPAAPATTNPVQPPSLVGPPHEAQPIEQAAPTETMDFPAPHDQDQITALVNLGRASLSQGDVATARLLLRRAASMGDAEAALELGMSYDPTFLSKLGVFGITPDITQAIEWYKKASASGSVDATRHLKRLAHLPN